ncbi:MAG: hypothetical protein HYV07_07680 [Deltaproteobacteria bacterium]|nr:hypothetical protein [Deltaproteobacteria bacterium]
MRLSLLYSTTVGPKFTSSAGPSASFAYSVLDFVSAEAWVSAIGTSGVPIAGEVRMQYAGVEPPLSDLHGLGPNVGIGATAGIWRGRVSLLGFKSRIDVAPGFGVGLGSITHQTGYLDQIAGLDTRTYDSKVAVLFVPSIAVELGLLGDGLALRAELRDFIYSDPAPNPFDDPKKDVDDFTQAVQLAVGLTGSLDPDDWTFSESEETKELGTLLAQASVGASFGDRYVTTRSLALSLSYNPLPYLGIELAGAYLMPTESGATSEMLREGKLTPYIADMGQLLYAATVGFRAYPVTGIMFGYMGGGIGVGARRVQCTSGLALDPALHGDGATCPEITIESGEDTFQVVFEPPVTTPVGYLTAGLWWPLTEYFGIGIEVRDFIFPMHVIRPGTNEPTQADTEALRQVWVGNVGVGASFG